MNLTFLCGTCGQFGYLPFFVGGEDDVDKEKGEEEDEEEDYNDDDGFDRDRTVAIFSYVRLFLRSQRREIVPYLQFDDGYEECIVPDDDNGVNANPEWRLKAVKLQHLELMANN